MKKLLLLLFCFSFISTICFAQTNIFPQSGSVGIGTTSPTHKLDILGSSRVTDGFLNSDNYFEKVLSTISFENGTANLAVDLRLGNKPLWGYIELEITSTYNYQNSAGKLTKIYAVGTVTGGTIYTNQSRVSDVIGTIGDNISLGELSWDNANSTYKIPISHIVNTGNVYSVKVKMFTNASHAKDVFDVLTIGPNYNLSPLPKNFVNFNGNVGIGTSTPTSKLDVVGGVSVDEGQGNGVKFSRSYGVHGHIYVDQPQGYLLNYMGHYGHKFQTNNGEVFRINSDGNVGIGTTTPNSKLDVRGGKIIAGSTNATQGSVVLESNYDQGGTYGSLSVLGTNYSTGGWILGYGISPKLGTTDAFVSATIGNLGRSAILVEGDLRFMTGNQQTVAIGSDFTMTERMKIANSGNVGIGTSNPSAKLDIRGNSFAGIQYLRTDAQDARISIGDNSGKVWSWATGWGGGTAGDFSLIEEGIAGDRIYIKKSSGNVGIGTTNPTAKLDVNGTANFTSSIMLSGGSGTAANKIGFNADANNYFIQGITNGMQYSPFSVGDFSFTSGNGNWKFVNGNVIIGSAKTPANYKLAVGGDVIAERVVVKLQTSWPDYVFKTGYSLRPLSEVEAFVKTNSHLPDVPSEAEIKEKGIDVEQMNATLLKKVEELTLYLIEMKKENAEIKARLQKVEAHK
jgi:Phage T4 tail fibre